MMTEYEECPQKITYKISVIGKYGIGKTTLLRKLVDKNDDEEPVNTVGTDLVFIEYHDKTITFWDTGGQEKFRSMAPLLYRGCHCIILMYDLNDSGSEEYICTFMEEMMADSTKGYGNDFYSSCKEVSFTPIILIGNKIDLVKKAKESKSLKLKDTIFSFNTDSRGLEFIPIDMRKFLYRGDITNTKLERDYYKVPEHESMKKLIKKDNENSNIRKCDPNKQIIFHHRMISAKYLTNIDGLLDSISDILDYGNKINSKRSNDILKLYNEESNENGSIKKCNC